MLSLEFFKALDLDSRVEFLSLKQDDFIEQFWNLFKEEPDSMKSKNLELELKILKNEVTHHQYFHLKENFNDSGN